MCRFARQNCLWQETVENMITLKKEGVSTSFIWSIFISCPDRLQNYTLDMELQKVREMIHDMSLHSYCKFTLSRSLVRTGC